MSEDRLRVLVIGQVPPPHGGQTIMTEVLLAGTYEDVELLHVNSAFSTALADMGTTSVRKVLRLAAVLARSLAITVARRPDVLYYHPAGASRSAILRDIVMLTALRPLFRTVVFHLHARGLVEACARLPGPLRAPARRAYHAPQLLLGPSAAIVDEAAHLRAGTEVVVPNGTAGGDPRTSYELTGPLHVVFVNLVSEAKGARWLLEAFATLVGGGVDARLTFVGEVASPDFHAGMLRRAEDLGIADRVVFAGPAVGPDKWRIMKDADVFCVPTTWPQESFGLALVEAASCALPVIAADVPGVNEVLENGVSVLLADPADRASLAGLLAAVAASAEVRSSLGSAARTAYLSRYTPEEYWRRIDGVFGIVKEVHHASARG